MLIVGSQCLIIVLYKVEEIEKHWTLNIIMIIIIILSVKSSSHTKPGLDVSLEAVAIRSCGVSVDLPGSVPADYLLQDLTRALNISKNQ